MRIRAFAPVSLGNFIVGFDILGAAVTAIDDGPPLGDVVIVEDVASDFEFVLTGPYANRLPGPPEENIAVTADRLFHEEIARHGLLPRPRRLTLEKCLPVGSGLGSSGTSAVATLAALNAFYSAPLTKTDLLVLAGALEGRISGSVHYDNVAPTLLGSLQLLLPPEEAALTGALTETLPLPDGWLFVVHYPGIVVSTRMAREILPATYTLPQVVSYAQRLAGFVDAVHRRDYSRAARLLRDEQLVEPHRARLVPGLEEARAAAYACGSLAFGLSGSGPTCFALADSPEKARLIGQAIEAAMPANPERFTRICRLAMAGTTTHQEQT